MDAFSNTLRPTATSRRRHAGFSFTEVLFAVMILGVGFIMIAGIFPVSLTQVKLSNEESTAANVARGAAAFLQRQAELPNGGDIFRSTVPVGSYPSLSAGQAGFRYGQVWSMYDSRMHPADASHPAQRDLAWGAVSGNLIMPTDPRYAWVAVYRRDATYFGNRTASGVTVVETPSPYAQVTIIPVAARNRSIFTKADDIDPTSKNLAAREAIASFTANGPVTFTSGGDAAAEGAYVIISSSPTGWMNGRVYRLGAKDTTATGFVFELVPGNDFQTDPGPDGDLGTTGDNISSLSGVPVLIVGKGLSGTDYEGAAMDVSVYTTYVKVN